MNPGSPEPGAAPALANPFADPSGILERHWRSMLAVAIAGALASLAVWWLIPLRYYAAATVVVSGSADSTGVLGDGDGSDTLPMSEVLVAEVLSSKNLAQLVSELDLYPELEGVMTTGEIAEHLRAQVSIRELKKLEQRDQDVPERVYAVGFEGRTPEAAVTVANRLAAALVEIDSAKQLRLQERSATLLRSELERNQAELDQRNAAISAFRREHRGSLPRDLRASTARLRNLDELRDKLVAARSQMTSKHPHLKDLERQIAAHQQELRALEARIAEMRVVADELNALEAAATVSREEYLALKRDLQRAELGGSLLGAQPGARLTVLNPAEPPARKVSTRWRYLALGLAASLALALALGFALELLRPVVISPDDILEITGHPVLGWVPRIR